MTFAALSTIHDLLENEKYKAEKVLEIAKYNYNEELDQMENDLGSRAKAAKTIMNRATYTRYEDAKNTLRKIERALEEFDAQDWR
jgi:hypothetical protein